jgi:hypothetical protein
MQFERHFNNLTDDLVITIQTRVPRNPRRSVSSRQDVDNRDLGFDFGSIPASPTLPAMSASSISSIGHLAQTFRVGDKPMHSATGFATSSTGSVRATASSSFTSSGLTAALAQPARQTGFSGSAGGGSSRTPARAVVPPSPFLGFEFISSSDPDGFSLDQQPSEPESGSFAKRRADSSATTTSSLASQIDRTPRFGSFLSNFVGGRAAAQDASPSFNVGSATPPPLLSQLTPTSTNASHSSLDRSSTARSLFQSNQAQTSAVSNHSIFSSAAALAAVPRAASMSTASASSASVIPTSPYVSHSLHKPAQQTEWEAAIPVCEPSPMLPGAQMPDLRIALSVPPVPLLNSPPMLPSSDPASIQVCIPEGLSPHRAVGRSRCARI